jgi:hypothetical protein
MASSRASATSFGSAASGDGSFVLDCIRRLSPVRSSNAAARPGRCPFAKRKRRAAAMQTPVGRNPTLPPSLSRLSSRREYRSLNPIRSHS